MISTQEDLKILHLAKSQNMRRQFLRQGVAYRNLTIHLSVNRPVRNFRQMS